MLPRSTITRLFPHRTTLVSTDRWQPSFVRVFNNTNARCLCVVFAIPVMLQFIAAWNKHLVLTVAVGDRVPQGLEMS